MSQYRDRTLLRNVNWLTQFLRQRGFFRTLCQFLAVLTDSGTKTAASSDAAAPRMPITIPASPESRLTVPQQWRPFGSIFLKRVIYWIITLKIFFNRLSMYRLWFLLSVFHHRGTPGKASTKGSEHHCVTAFYPSVSNRLIKRQRN